MRKSIFLLLILASTRSAAAPTLSAPAAKVEHVMGVCQLIANPVNDIKNPMQIIPAYAVYEYLTKYSNLTGITLEDIAYKAKFSIIQTPSHGDIKRITNDNQIEIFGYHKGNFKTDSSFAYIPAVNYSGEDKLTVQVDVEGYGSVKVMYFLNVINVGPSMGSEFTGWLSKPGNNPCGDGKEIINTWKIN